jgi:integrase
MPKVEKLASGTWRTRVYVEGKQVSVTGADRKSCLAKAAAMMAGAVKPGKSLTLTKAIDRYIETRENILSPSTIRGYRIIQRNRFQPLMGQPLTSITSAQWKSAVNREATLCSAKTLKNSWLFVCSVLRENGILPPRVTLPQVICAEREFLEPEDIPVFVQAAKGTNVAIPAFLALSSMRCSEILALTWDNVDLEHGVIHVRGAVVPDEHHKMVRKKENKNTTSRRDIPIFLPELASALQSGGEGKVVNCTGQTILKRINALCASQGLPEVGVHGLRHSFASLCYSLNVPEKVVMQIGGWADNATMRKIYTHLAQRDLDKNVDALKDFFQKQDTKQDTNCNLPSVSKA